MSDMRLKELPIPPHYNPQRVGEVWRVPYQQRAAEARQWAERHNIEKASEDMHKICLLLIDVQNTFCLPEFELFVGGRSGMGAVEDNRRLCNFIYRNLSAITAICATLDTHQAMQIFHSLFLINDRGEPPPPFTLISRQDIRDGVWHFNAAVAAQLGLSEAEGRRHLEHYVERLHASGKYELTIWPYHAMLGGIGHALVPAVEEAIFFHTLCRCSQPDFHLKGNNPLTENYSALQPEVMERADGGVLGAKNEQLIKKLLQFDAVIVAGQAKSHCVAWTISDLLKEIENIDRRLTGRFYLLEDCSSPVVVPNVIDYTAQANEAYERFRAAGMHVVASTAAIASWPGIGR